MTVAELVAGVTIGLNGGRDDACPDYRCAGPGCVMIHMLVSAVEYALSGCPAPQAPPTPVGIDVPPPTVPPPPTPDDVVLALQSVQGATCHVVGPISQSSAWATERGYSMYCLAGPGHDTRTAFVRYGDAAQAAAQWVAEGEPGEPFDLEGLPAAYWEVPFQIRPLEGAHRFLVWQLGCWVITIHAFDDTHFRIAPSPHATAQAILLHAAAPLFALCAGE